MDEDNDRWIEKGLTASFHRLDLGSPPHNARYKSTTPNWGKKRMSLLAGLPAALTTKAAAAAFAVTLTAAGGVAAKTVATGNPNPLSWGAAVTTQVQTCNAALTAGQHGIGQCVSTTASQKGQQQRTAHAPTLPSQAAAGQTHPTGAPSLPSQAASGQSHPTGAPPLPSQDAAGQNHPTGTPTLPSQAAAGQNHPTGAPTPPSR
jgi:hypothetical protein